MEFKEPQPPENDVRKKFIEIRRRLFEKTLHEISPYFNFYREKGDYEKLKKLLLEYLDEKGVPELKDQLSFKLSAISPADDKMDQKMVDAILEVLAENLTLEEIEEGSKQSIAEKGYKLLSRALSYQITNQHGGGREVNLHIPTNFFNTSREAIQSIQEGLRNLAIVLKNDADLADIKEIFGVSKLVINNPRLFKSLGFEVDTESGNALMSRERLLDLYGPKDEK